MGDSRIGNVLAYAPADPDGTWPCEGVREAIEVVHSDELDRGLAIGVINKRGVHFQKPGGDQERAIRDTFRGHAARVQSRWPQTAKILNAIAERYNWQAKEEDKQAELEEFE